MTENEGAEPQRRTPEELREAVEAMRWSKNDVGRIFGIDSRTARRWFSGAIECPHNVADWLVRCADFMRVNPPPSRFEYDDEPADEDTGDE